MAPFTVIVGGGNWVKVKTEQGEIGWCFENKDVFILPKARMPKGNEMRIWKK